MPAAHSFYHSPIYLSPSPSPSIETPPQPILEEEEEEELNDRLSDMTRSRASSVVLPPSGTSSPPTLREILSNSAPAPYTLAAFMGFLSQNHCLETLEFTMEADRYRAAFNDAFESRENQPREWHNERICTLWDKLMRAYIFPCGAREVNLPAHVRDRLLRFPSSPHPPHPSELDDAVRIVYELMSDSVLVPFFESASPHRHSITEPHHPDETTSRPVLTSVTEGRRTRAWHHSRGPSSGSGGGKSPTSPDEVPRSARMGILPLLTMVRSEQHGRQSTSSSVDGDRDGCSEGSASPASHSTEPMTPPTTPPTSDWSFVTASPGSFQRAMAAHNNGWKKMGAKLGLGKKTQHKRSSSSLSTHTSLIDADLNINSGYGRMS